jgi:hypothetical protein
MKDAGTLLLRTHHGTESKVSTGPPPEQTSNGVTKIFLAGFVKRELS